MKMTRSIDRSIIQFKSVTDNSKFQVNNRTNTRTWVHQIILKPVNKQVYLNKSDPEMEWTWNLNLKKSMKETSDRTWGKLALLDQTLPSWPMIAAAVRVLPSISHIKCSSTYCCHDIVLSFSAPLAALCFLRAVAFMVRKGDASREPQPERKVRGLMRNNDLIFSQEFWCLFNFSKTTALLSRPTYVAWCKLPPLFCYLINYYYWSRPEANVHHHVTRLLFSDSTTNKSTFA